MLHSLHFLLAATCCGALACGGGHRETASPHNPPAAKASRLAPARCLVPSDELRRLVVAVSDKQRNVGLQVAVWRDGSVAYRLALGLADIEHRAPVTDETRFGIASVTKLFTAVTLLELAAAGRLDLDAPVQTYVPAFPEKDQGTITIRMLATHRSGIPHPRDRTPELFATHYDTATDALEVFAAAELLFAPGTGQRYSSSNYNLLAAVIEAVHERPFVEVVRAMVTSPLGLADTAFDDVRRVLPHRSRRYSYYHPRTYEESDELFVVPSWDYSFNAGGGNMVSTAADLVRFGAALFEPGLLGQAEWALLFSPDWFGDESADSRLFASGANPGLQASLAIHPTTKTAAAVLANTWGIGSRSAEMTKLAAVLATRCAGGTATDP